MQHTPRYVLDAWWVLLVTQYAIWNFESCRTQSGFCLLTLEVCIWKMGLRVCQDTIQEKMSKLMAGLECAQAYLDDLLIISNEKGYKKTLTKTWASTYAPTSHWAGHRRKQSFFGRTSLEYLGYSISQEGIWQKVEAILQIKPPTTRKQLRRFIGMVNYYRDMWPKWSHLLAQVSLVALPNVKWKWTEKNQQSFDQMKALMTGTQSPPVKMP